MVRQSFEVSNTGDTAFSVSWRAPAPFAISPEQSGPILPAAAQLFTAAFTASDASVFTGTALCIIDGGDLHPVKLTGIGKFPFLQLSEQSVDHGEVLVGTASKQSIRLLNQSLVTAAVQIRHGPGPNDGVFRVTPTDGNLAPGSWLDLTLHFRPASAGTWSSETFCISTPGGHCVQLRQQGIAASISADLSASILDFGDVAVGTSNRMVQRPVKCMLFNCLTAAECWCFCAGAADHLRAWCRSRRFQIVALLRHSLQFWWTPTAVSALSHAWGQSRQDCQYNWQRCSLRCERQMRGSERSSYWQTELLCMLTCLARDTAMHLDRRLYHLVPSLHCCSVYIKEDL
jgi:hypothetical protein